MTNIQQIGDYRILAPLESRGSGQSYLAEQKSLKRKVVLKLLPAPTPRALKRFREEAENLASMQFSRFASVFEYSTDGNLFYFAMEFIPGVSFEEMIALGQRDIPYLVERVAEVCEAIDNAHRSGFIHRDLRPTNLIVDTSGHSRITDFALARNWDDQSMTRSQDRTQGSLYQSPEQIMPGGNPVTAATDIFNLGVILYEMVTGVHPFDGDSFTEVEDRILAGHPKPPRFHAASLSKDLEAIILKAIDRDPAQRYARALDFATDLRCFLRGEQVSVHRLGPAGRAGRWIRQRWKVAAAVAVMTSLSFAAWQANQSRRVESFQEYMSRYSRTVLKANQFQDILRNNAIVTDPQGNSGMLKVLKAMEKKKLGRVADTLYDEAQKDLILGTKMPLGSGSIRDESKNPTTSDSNRKKKRRRFGNIPHH